jgi:hypothetical protein
VSRHPDQDRRQGIEAYLDKPVFTREKPLAASAW